MTPLKLFSIVFRSLLTVIVIFGFILVMLNYMNLSFALDGARSAVVEQIEKYTGRDARIDGRLKLTVSFPPQLLVERLHVSNIDGFDDKDFISIDKAQIEVPLLPLLSGQIHLGTISADQAKINLIQTKDGGHNWSFEQTEQASRPADPSAKKTGGKKVTLGTFQLTNVALIYKDESRDQVIKKQLDRLIIDLKDRTSPIAEISGSVQGHPYTISFKSDALETLFAGEQWLLYGTGDIAGSHTEIEARLQLQDNTLNGNLDINVNKVDLGALLDTLGIVSEQELATENININTKVRGSTLIELYEQAEIKLQLGKGYWNLQPTDSNQKKVLSFSSASTFTSWNKPVELHLDGNIAGEAVTLEFKTNPLQEFFDEVNKLDVDLTSSIASTDISLKGALDLPIKTKQFQLDISLKGTDLEKLNPVIGTEFPPFNDFGLSGSLIANERGYILKSVNASIGKTEFQTSIVIETTLPKRHWIISFNSQQLQLKDFAFDDWNIKQTDAKTEDSSKQKGYERRINIPLRRLEDLVRSPLMHFDLNLKVDNLLSGEDHLGKARFQLHLRDNAISLKNADIEIPGGRITASISLALEDNEASGHAILNIDKLDYGISTRLFEPDSLIDGILSIRADLQLDGRNFTRLLENATGEFDFAVWPKNTKPAKALNLWTTNLYLILLPELKKKDSFVNCLVGLIDIDEGKMKEELFAIDTTRLWIYGNINVDFVQEYVELSLFPQSKTARLFSLQTPIRAQGSFTNIDLLLNPLDLTETYISFITSPLHVPVRRIFGDKPPKDGSAICEQLFDREYVKKLKAETEKKEKQEIDRILESY